MGLFILVSVTSKHPLKYIFIKKHNKSIMIKDSLFLSPALARFLPRAPPSCWVERDSKTLDSGKETPCPMGEASRGRCAGESAPV